MFVSIIADHGSCDGADNPITIIEAQADEFRHTLDCALETINAISTSFTECAKAVSNMFSGMELWPARDDEVGSFVFPVQVSLPLVGWSDLFNVLAHHQVNGEWSVMVVSKQHKNTRRERKGVKEADLGTTIVALLREVDQDSSVLTSKQPT